MTSTRISAPFTATHVEAPAATPTPLPVGWTVELLAAVEAGRISFRRAVAMVERDGPSSASCPVHGPGCAVWEA